MHNVWAISVRKTTIAAAAYMLTDMLTYMHKLNECVFPFL